MGDRIANPRALGFSALAIGTWMFSLSSAGWSTPVAETMHQVVPFGLLALFIAALASFLRNETWYAVFFMFWAAYVWGVRATMGGTMTGPSAFDGWYEIAIAVISLFLLLSALRAAAGPAIMLLNLGYTLLFSALALGDWLGGHFWIVVAGYIGLVTGLVVLWAAWNEFVAIGGEAGAKA